MTSDAVPLDVRAAALRAIDAREHGAVLADLVMDSVEDEQSGAGSRSLLFAGGGLDLELALYRDPLTRTSAALVLVTCEGQPTSGVEVLEVDVRERAAPEVLRLTPARWALRSITSGPLRLVVHQGAGRVQTAWIRC